MKTDKVFQLLLLALATVLVVSLAHLFNLRYAVGDVYPPYSSLRADPLGVKVLYDSLQNLPSVSARRNYQPLSRLANKTGQTVLYCGVQPNSLNLLTESEVKDFENLVATDNRLVISLFPVNQPPRKQRTKKAGDQDPEDSSKSPAHKKSTDDEDAWDTSPREIDLTNRWGFAMEYATAQALSSNTNRSIWHSALFFDHLDKRWRVSQTNGEHPVVIERKFGSGMVILCADSYFLSNEAMRKDRQPELLAQLIGTDTDIVFDEIHLGVSEHPGVMTLAHKYHLQGLFLAITVLAALFVWKNSVSLVPRHLDETVDASVALSTDKDVASGLVNLFRRSIPLQQLLPVCWSEWEKSFSRGSGGLNRNREKAQVVVENQATLPAKQQTVVAAYQTLCELLSGRK